MNAIRTIIWVLITALVVGFVVLNWGEPQQVKIWPGGTDNDFLFEWPVGFMALVFFLAGFIPMWLYHRGVKWALNRRVAALENAARVTAAVAPVTPAPSSGEPASQTGTLSSEDTPAP